MSVPILRSLWLNSCRPRSWVAGAPQETARLLASAVAFVHPRPSMTRKAQTGHSGARPPVERMLKIHHLIKSGKLPNATSIAAALEVSVRSVMRDLDFMRERLNLPLEYDASKHGFFYTQEVEAFPTLQITEGELFALLVAEKALQQYRGTNFEKPLLSAFKKMAASLPDTISLNLADWEQTISFHTSAEPILNLEVF